MTDEPRWMIYEDAGDVIVLPICDIRAHDPRNPNCPCMPQVEVIGARLKIVHNAFDFRHVAEWLAEPHD